MSSDSKERIVLLCLERLYEFQKIIATREYFRFLSDFLCSIICVMVANVRKKQLEEVVERQL